MITETTSAPAPGTPDAKGTLYDPARHIPRQNPRTGLWLPRSPGRAKRPPASPANQRPLHGVGSPAESQVAAGPSSAPSSNLPTREITIQELLPELTPATPPAPPPAPAQTQPATGPAPSPQPPPPAAPIPEVGPAPDPASPEPADGSPTPPPSSGKDLAATREAAAELAARATYAVTGVIIRDHKKATATGAEHEALKRGYASFFEYRNIVLVGGIALGAVIIAYLLGEARREEVTGVVTGLFRKKPRPVGPVVDVDPAPPPAAGRAKPATTPVDPAVMPSRVDSW